MNKESLSCCIRDRYKAPDCSVADMSADVVLCASVEGDITNVSENVWDEI